MKYISLFLSLFILHLLLPLPVFAFTPYSFRYQATASLFWDDFDFILNPATIPNVKGSRLFTNLSNLISQKEEFIADSSENTFLIGGSTDYLRFILPAFVHTRYLLNRPLMTNLTDRQGNPIYGKGREVNTEWQDIDNNGSYDYKIVREREEEASYATERNNFYLGLGKTFGPFTFGIGYFREASTSSHLLPDSNFNYLRTDYSLISGSFTYAETAHFTGEMKEERGFDKFLLSSSYKKGDLAFYLSLGIAPLKTTETNYLTGESAKVRSPVDLDRYLLSQTTDLPISGFFLPIDFSIYHTMERQEGMTGYEGRYFLSYRIESRNLADGKIINQESSYTSLAPGFLQRREGMIEERKGKAKENRFCLTTHQLFFPSERLSFGIGLEFFLANLFDSTHSLSYNRTFLSFDNGDGRSTREDSSVERFQEEGALSKRTGLTYGLAIPVGFEYKPINWFALRLGSIYTHKVFDQTEVTNMTSFSPWKRIITYGDGTRREVIDWTEEKVGTKEDRKEATNTTTFTYGIGITPKDFISIDLTGFGELLNLNEWKISITFKF